MVAGMLLFFVVVFYCLVRAHQ